MYLSSKAILHVFVLIVRWLIVLIVERSAFMLESYDDLLTTEEACEALKVGKNALYALLRSQKLNGYRNGRVWRIPRIAVEEYIRKQSNLL